MQKTPFETLYESNSGAEVVVNNVDVPLSFLGDVYSDNELRRVIKILKKQGLLDYADNVLSNYHADTPTEIYDAIIHGLGKVIE